MDNEGTMVSETYSFCRRCAHRIEFGRVRVGTHLTCPNCGFDFRVAGPTHRHAGAGQGSEAGKEEHAAKVLRQWPSADLFFSGTFRFPFYRRTFWRFTMLAIGAIAAAGVVELAAWSLANDHDGVDRFTRVLLWNSLLVATSCGTIVALVWLVAASADGLAIVRETSGGSDAVQDWPNLLVREGLGDVAYVVNAFFLSLLPGLLGTPLWLWLEAPQLPMLVAFAPVLFPVFLLSMLGTSSATAPFSPVVWGSLIPAWRVWGLFYLVTFGEIGVVIAVGRAAHHYGNGVVLAAVSGILVAATWIVYCRLLGRLAWFCFERPTRDAHQ